MDTEHRVITGLLALKDAPDDVLLDQVRAVGERAARHMLADEAARLQHTDQLTATDCAALIDRLATDESDVLEPAFIRMLAETHTAIAAVDAELIDGEGAAQ
jgi:hypothetical protein